MNPTPVHAGPTVSIDGIRDIAQDLAGIGLPARITLAAVLGAAVLITIAVMSRRTAGRHRTPDRAPDRARDTGPAGAKGFYAVAALSMLVSIDTSWRYFGDVLHITNDLERAAMFGVVEAALIACGYGMRANVRRTGRPGSPQLIAWTLCGVAAYMAWQLSGVGAGLLRVAVGPLLGLVMLHLALGIDMRHAGAKTSNGARIRRELTARVLSRLGLGDDDRTAAARTRDRAGRRVARLAYRKRALFRDIRLRRATLASGAAHDPVMRNRILAELAVLQHTDALTALAHASPWSPNTDAATPRPGTPRRPEPLRPRPEPHPAPPAATPAAHPTNGHHPANGHPVTNGRHPATPRGDTAPEPADVSDTNGDRDAASRLRALMRTAHAEGTSWDDINAADLARQVGVSPQRARTIRAELKQAEKDSSNPASAGHTGA